MRIGIVTTDSFERTINYSLEIGKYNQARAHVNNIIQIAKIVNNGPVTIYDIGEKRSRNNDEVLDDLDLYERGDDVVFLPCSMVEFFNDEEDKYIIFYLYYYIDSKASEEYLYKLSEHKHLAIYYASDDEVYFDHYLLRELLNGNFPALKENLKMILSGHMYSIDYPGLCDYIFHLPMFPNKALQAHFSVDNDITKDCPYDIFVNCHHHTRLMEHLLLKLPNRKILAFMNKGILDYLKMLLGTNDLSEKFPNVDVIYSDGANTLLEEIIKFVRRCKVYLLPNTYYHVDDWYREGHYPQSIMYTHKMLEAFYSNRLVLGDCAMQHLDEINALPEFNVPTRKEYYNQILGISDPMIIVRNKAMETTKEVAKIIIDLINK